VKVELKQALSRRKKHVITDNSRVPAAVLIPLYEKDGQTHIVFIQRTETVREHKGQIAFPGGGRESGDNTLLETAVRESQEEIGLNPEDVEIIGELDDQITTTSNYIVTSFVGIIPYPYRFVNNPNEVAKIIEAPISALLDKRCFKSDTEFDEGRKVQSWSYYYQGDVIWGATARILYKFLKIYCRAINTKEKS
jgi:8-oxo-dGTP pyrophosphatase MutT (NUDIX family)